MPIVRIDWYAGRTPAQKAEVAEAVTRELARIAECAPAEVEILFNDVPRSDWATGGVLGSAQ
jgi:4-oxalocrotonate tautomerase